MFSDMHEKALCGYEKNENILLSSSSPHRNNLHQMNHGCLYSSSIPSAAKDLDPVNMWLSYRTVEGRMNVMKEERGGVPRVKDREEDQESIKTHGGRQQMVSGIVVSVMLAKLKKTA